MLDEIGWLLLGVLVVVLGELIVGYWVVFRDFVDLRKARGRNRRSVLERDTPEKAGEDRV